MIEFTYIVDGKVMCGPEKPKLKETTTQVGNLMYRKALTEWRAGLEPVVNARLCKTTGDIDIVNKQGDIINTLVGIKSGQKVETRETPEGKVITKIL